MISAENFPAQNFSRTTSGNRPLASWQLDLSSLSPGLSSANAGVVRTVRLTMVSTVSPQRIKRDLCIACPLFHRSYPTSPIGHRLAEPHTFTLLQAGPRPYTAVRTCLASLTFTSNPVDQRFFPSSKTKKKAE